MASTVITIATPGKANIHHSGRKMCEVSAPSMLPQVGVGGRTPTPR